MTNVLVSHWSFTFWWAELTLSQGLSFSCCPAKEWAEGAHSRIRAADPTDQKHILLSFHKVSKFVFFSVSPWLPLISQKGYWPYQIRGSSSQQIYVGISHPPLRLQTQAKHQDKRIIKIQQFFWTAANRQDSNLLYTSQAMGMLSAIISHLGWNKQIYHIT